MKKEIQEKLRNLEAQYQIKILFAIESGSRAWGFPSPDSDYDVRFIYKHTSDWYLTIDELKDTLETMDGDLDLVGWEVRKALRLLRKSNASLFEKIQSPILYIKQGSFWEEIKAIAPAYFSCRAGLYHYKSMANRYYEACAPNQMVKLKSYFYLLRTTLASLWIVENQSVPPMQFVELLPLVQDENIKEIIIRMMAIKAGVSEKYLHPKEQQLESYLQQQLAYCESKANELPKSNGDTDALNQLFRKTILQDEPYSPEFTH